MKTDTKLNNSVSATCARTYNKIASLISRSRALIVEQFRELAADHQHALRLVLNEAEALAWQSEFPHLLFQDLAEEKARGFSDWLEHQRVLRPDLARVNVLS
jgi:hypothetical protein